MMRLNKAEADIIVTELNRHLEDRQITRLWQEERFCSRPLETARLRTSDRYDA